MMRLKRSTVEDRQKLITETAVENDQTFSSTDPLPADTHCPQLEAERMHRFRFSASSAMRPTTGNASVTVHIGETNATSYDATASPLRSDNHGSENSSIATPPVGEHSQAANVEAHDAVTSSDDIKRTDDETDDVTLTIHVVDESDVSYPTSPFGDESGGHSVAEIDGQDETSCSRKTKKTNRRQKAKRYAKQVSIVFSHAITTRPSSKKYCLWAVACCTVLSHVGCT